MVIAELAGFDPTYVHTGLADTTDAAAGPAGAGTGVADSGTGRTESDTATDASSDGLDVHKAGTRHKNLIALHQAGNEARYGFIHELRLLNEWRQFLELGFSSLAQYCDRVFGIRRSTAHGYVRVAKALDELPVLRTMFRAGDMSWHQVREISRVATAETEVEWIKLAKSEPVKVLEAELREAKRTGRTAPRDRRFGLPNLTVTMAVRVTMDEKQRILAALARVSHALQRETGDGADADPRPALLRWADGILAGTIPAGPGDGAANGTPPEPSMLLVNRHCPGCKTTQVETDEGSVNVDAERLEYLQAHAQVVDITPEDEAPAEPMPDGEVDKPTSKKMRLQVLARDGMCCANPGCNRRVDLQGHHKRARADGGRTCLDNLVTLCSICHALYHNKLLDITWSPGEPPKFKPMARVEGVDVLDVEAICERAEALTKSLPKPPSNRANGARGTGGTGTTAGGRRCTASGAPLPRTTPSGESTTVDSARRVKLLASGLRRWGYTKSESEELIEEAYDALLFAAYMKAEEEGGDPEPVTDEDILRHALFGAED